MRFAGNLNLYFAWGAMIVMLGLLCSFVVVVTFVLHVGSSLQEFVDMCERDELG